MAWQLGRLLGPAKMWQIARLLGASGVPADAAPDPGRRRFLRTVGGAALGLAVLSGTKALTPLVAGAQESQITIEPADAKTREKLLKQARSDKRVRKLNERLLADGFTPSGEPRVFVGRQNGRILRTVATTPYTGATAGLTADLQFGLEPDGQQWTQAPVVQQGQPTRVEILWVTDSGAVEVRRPGEVTPQVLGIDGCAVCRGFLYIGACGIGCATASVILCGPLAVGCFGICAALCGVNGGPPSEYTCTYLGYCP